MIKNKRQYKKAMKRLDELLDIIGEDESHPLMEELEPLSDDIREYEDKHYPVPERASAVNTVAFLVDEHIMAGVMPSSERELLIKQATTVDDAVKNGDKVLALETATALAERFSVNPATFLPDGFSLDKVG